MYGFEFRNLLTKQSGNIDTGLNLWKPTILPSLASQNRRYDLCKLVQVLPVRVEEHQCVYRVSMPSKGYNLRLDLIRLEVAYLPILADSRKGVVDNHRFHSG